MKPASSRFLFPPLSNYLKGQFIVILFLWTLVPALSILVW